MVWCELDNGVRKGISLQAFLNEVVAAGLYRYICIPGEDKIEAGATVAAIPHRLSEMIQAFQHVMMVHGDVTLEDLEKKLPK